MEKRRRGKIEKERRGSDGEHDDKKEVDGKKGRERWRERNYEKQNRGGEKKKSELAIADQRNWLKQ